MKNCALLLGLILGICSSVFGEAPPVERWAASYNGPGNSEDGGYAMAVDNFGNVYVTGSSNGSGTDEDYATVKYDPNGNQLWAARYNGDANGTDWASEIAVDGSGNVYVTGISMGSGIGYDYATIKYGPDGNQLWVARYNEPGNSSDSAYGLAIDISGNVYVTGTSTGSGPYTDFATVKYDPNGNQLWAARYNGPANNLDVARCLAVDLGGNVYVTGYSFTAFKTSDFATVKYDSDGNQLWVARYNGDADGSDCPEDLALDYLGNVCVTGWSRSAGFLGEDYVTIKYAPDGNQLWVARYNGDANSDDDAHALAVDSSGNIYVTGSSNGSGTSIDYATIKYDPDGNQLWVARYNWPGDSWNIARDLAIDSSSNVYVTGENGGLYGTVKYGPDGNQLWGARYGNRQSPGDSAYALALDNSGSVYVTGKSYGINTGFDYATIKYTQHDYCAGPVVGDLNNDCKVDFSDFAVMAAHWLECNYALEEDCW